MQELRFISERLGGVENVKSLLEGLFFHAPVAFQVYGADGRCLLVNPAFRQLFGSEPPPEYNVLEDELAAKQGIVDLVQRAFAGEIVRLPASWYDARELHRVEIAEGRPVAIEVTLFPLRDREQAIRHVALCFKDVTSEQELKAASEALRISEARYRTQFEAAPEAIVTLDVDSGCFVEVNTNAQRLFGYTREQLFRMNPVDVSAPVQPDGRAAKEAAVEYIGGAMSGERQVFEWMHRSASGEDIPCEIRLVRLPGSGQNLCRGSIIDIGERKRAEAARLQLEEALRKTEDQLRQSQKMESIGRLAGGIAHDFNNLLSVVLGYSAIALASLDPADPLAQEIQEIKSAGERAANLTRQLLAFSRQQVLAPAIVDLNETVRRMDKMLRRVIGEDVDLRVVTPATLGKTKVDPGQIEQVIMNLTVNARDAMPAGGTLTIETGNVTLDRHYASMHVGVTPGPHVMLAVTDTGIGMDKELQGRIFDPFFTTKEQGRGTGLGLSTVLGIVEQSHGHIQVYSEPGTGTSFKVYFPRTDETQEAAFFTVPPTTLRGSETLLLVEDEAQLRALGRTVLTSSGYQVLVAEGPAEALAHCKEALGAIHLLVTDVIMPRMNGRELAEQAVLLHPQMKVLYVSGYTDNTIVHHGVLAEGIAFLQKPFTPDALLRKVRETLDTPSPR